LINRRHSWRVIAFRRAPRLH